MGESEGLKLAIFVNFCDVLVTYKGIPPLYVGLFSLISVGSKIGLKKVEIRQ